MIRTPEKNKTEGIGEREAAGGQLGRVAVFKEYGHRLLRFGAFKELKFFNFTVLKINKTSFHPPLLKKKKKMVRKYLRR